MAAGRAIGYGLPMAEPDRRQPVRGAHDDREREEIRALLRELPDDHPVWDACREGADALELARIAGRKELVYKLTKAWLEGHERELRRSRKCPAGDSAIDRLAARMQGFKKLFFSPKRATRQSIDR